MCFYCNSELLNDNGNGKIYRDCEHKFYYIQYGNVDITMSKNRLISFGKFLNSLTDDKIDELTDRWQNKIVIKQQGFMGGYSFVINEFYDFRLLITETVGQLYIEDELFKILNNE